MPARVPDAGKRVLFGADREVPGAVAGFGRESSRKIANSALDFEALAVEELANPVGGLFFLKSRLGICMNPATEIDEAGANGFQFLFGSRFWVSSIAGRALPVRAGVADEAVAVRHLHLRQRLCVHDGVFFDNAVQ